MNSIAQRAFFPVAGALLMVMQSSVAVAQFKGLGGAADHLKGKLPDLLGGSRPISTSLADASRADASKDGFTPQESPRSLMTLERTANGGFVLEPGYFIMQAQSYCLMAGTHGPGGGDGYLYAPVKGAADDVVLAIVRNSVRHAEIEQRQIQALLWAVLARAKFEDLSPELRATAGRLLTARQLATLNRSALDVLSGNALTDALGGVPEPLRQIAQAEANLRQMMTTSGATFAEIERVAVLSGAAPLGQGSQVVPSGRWSMHPDGYFVRYIPTGYSSTRIEIWVPQGTPVLGKEFDPATHIAIPGNTARQRLIQSGRAQTK